MSRPSPATLISLLTLFIALGGTAVGLQGTNRVDSGDIKRGAVKPADTDLTKFKRVGQTIVVGPETPVDTHADPTVKVRAKRGDQLLIQASVTGRKTAGPNGCAVGLEPTGPDGSLGNAVMMNFTSSSFVEKYLGNISGGSAAETEAFPRAIPAFESGIYRFLLRLIAADGATCEFRNRMLLVTVLR